VGKPGDRHNTAACCEGFGSEGNEGEGNVSLLVSDVVLERARGAPKMREGVDSAQCATFPVVWTQKLTGRGWGIHVMSLQHVCGAVGSQKLGGGAS